MAYILLIVYFGMLRLWIPLPQVAAVPFSQLKGGGLLTAAGPLRPNTAALGTAGLLIGRAAAREFESNSFPDYIAPVGKFMKIEFLDPFDF